MTFPGELKEMPWRLVYQYVKECVRKIDTGADLLLMTPFWSGVEECIGWVDEGWEPVEGRLTSGNCEEAGTKTIRAWMNFLYRSFGEQVLNNATRCKFGFTNASDFIDGAEFKDSLSGRCRHGTYFFPGVNRRTGMGVGITLDKWSEIEHCSITRNILYRCFILIKDVISNFQQWMIATQQLT